MQPTTSMRLHCTLTIFLLRAFAVQTHPQTSVAFGFASGRIVGGHDAPPHSAPWLVSMQYGRTAEYTRHMCAGSIIQPHWVLTAAHCLDAVPAFGTWVLLAGRHNIRNAETSTEQRRPVVRRQTWRHPRSAVGRVAPFDIALIRVAQPFDVSPSSAAGVIALPAAERMHVGLAQLHGWGSTSTTHVPANPAVLQTVAKPIVPWAECERALGAGSALHETNVCTGPLTGGVAACSGDSGGALTQAGELVGVVSWGRVPCGALDAPSVHVRVSAFIGWIGEVIELNSEVQ